MAKTSAGRTIFYDSEGSPYSEKTETIKTKFGWVNTPTVNESGNQVNIDEISDWLNSQNNPIDFVTGKPLQVFNSSDEAVKVAQETSNGYGNELQSPPTFSGRVLRSYFKDDPDVEVNDPLFLPTMLPWNRYANLVYNYNHNRMKNPPMDYNKYDMVPAPLSDKMNQTMQEYARRSRPNSIEPIALRAEYYDSDMGRDYIPVYSDEDRIKLVQKEMDAEETQDYIDNTGYAVGPLGAYKGYMK